MENNSSITVPLPSGYSGRILVYVESGVKASYMELPEDYIVGATDALVELMVRADYVKPAPPYRLATDTLQRKKVRR